jgi:hypothetical protein
VDELLTEVAGLAQTRAADRLRIKG